MIVLRDDVVFDNPQSRIREYCEIEIYRGYDNKHSIDNSISQEDVNAANVLNAMIDKIDKHESKRLLIQSRNNSKILSQIPNIDIFSIPNIEWVSVRSMIKKLFMELLSIRGFNLTKTSIILHLKRPKLIPVLDSFIIKFLLDVDDLNIDNALRALDKTREIMLEQKIEFEKLVKKTNDLPIFLTPIRMFCILCWTTEKWDIRRNPNAPHGTANKSLLPISKKDKKSVRNNINKSSAMIIVEDFINELIKKAWYGIKSEKPLATIAAIKFLHDNEMFHIELIELIEGKYSNNVRRNFINLAKKSKKINDPNNSWSEITRSNNKLQNSINQFRYGDVNKAFCELTKKEIKSLLNSYLRRL